MQEISFRPVLPEDLPQLAAFCSQFPEDGRSIEFWNRRFQHWWQDNPAMTDDWLRGFQLFADGFLQGCILNIPLRVVVEGVEHIASLGSTWRVMPGYRAFSLLLANQVDQCHNHLLRFNGTPTPKVRQIIKNAKLLKDSYRCIREWVEIRIISANKRSLLAKLIGLKSRSPTPLPKLIFPCNLSQDLIKEMVNTSWQRCKNVTGPIRDWQYWQWYSVNNPTVNISTVIIPASYEYEDALCAMLLDVGDGQLRIADVWPGNPQKKQWRQLLKVILSHAKRSGFHTILVPRLTSQMSVSNTFFTVKRKDESLGIWTNPFPLPELSDNHYWPLYAGDALI